MSTWIAGKGTVPAITTNADRLRAMSDEEIADWLCLQVCPTGPDCRHSCYDCWIEWLKEECDDQP